MNDWSATERIRTLDRHVCDCKKRVEHHAEISGELLFVFNFKCVLVQTECWMVHEMSFNTDVRKIGQSTDIPSGVVNTSRAFEHRV